MLKPNWDVVKINQKGIKSFHKKQSKNKKARIISFQMLKGGVSKTTSALNIALRASQYGLKVLTIDLDQQANLSFALGATHESLPVWIDVIEKKVSIQQAILPVCHHLNLLPSNLNNSVIEKVLLKSYRNWAHSVELTLQDVIYDYDWIIIDTAPSLSMLNTSVTCASDYVILPVTPDPFAVLGLKKHLEEVKEIKKEFILKKPIIKILLTKFDGRESISQKYLDVIATNYEDMLLDSYVRVNSQLKKVLESGRNIFQSQCAAKEDYDLVTRELINLIGHEEEQIHA